MRFPSSVALLATLCAVLLPSHVQAQVSAIAPRIAGPVDETALTLLKGNVSPIARADFDKGEAAPSTEMRQVRLLLSRSPEQEAALNKLMAEQLDKTSPNYQHWLTPQEFNRQFGVADSDLAAIHAWLESHGLTVNYSLSDHTSVAFSGTVRQIEDTFHTTIHQFEGNGQSYLANTVEPQIPAALSAVVAGVSHLNTFSPVPLHVKAPSGMLDPQSGQFTPSDSGSLLARPDFVFASNRLYVVAADAATIYNTPNSLNANFSGSSYTGKGVIIGIGGQNAINQTTVTNYRSLFVGDSTAPLITNINNTAVIGSDTDEAYIDVELSGGIAPGATIHFYTDAASDGGVFTDIPQMLADNTVDIFSLSYGLCEYFFTKDDNAQINAWWQQAAAQGIAVLVSTGDSAAAGCDNNVQTAQYGLQVNGLASTPYNIAVGGTDFHGLLNGGFSTYVGGTPSAASFYRTAKSFIPESTWNDSITNDGLLSANQPNTRDPKIVGGSGGVSACTNNTTTYDTKGNVHLGTCSGGYAKPSWQRGPGVPNDGARDIPDVSLFSGNGYFTASWLVCTDELDSSNNNLPENCTNQGGNIYFSAFGGTSTAAPAMAGILALVQEKNGGGGQSHRLGLNGAKTLYDLYNGAHASAVFHDTTISNISVPCTSGTPNCAMNGAGFNFLTGYDTGTGYDLATGLGSVDATALVTYWGAATGANTATVTVTPASSTADKTQALSVSITVSGSAGTPTGSVTLSGGGYTSAATSLDANGKATINIPANSFTTAGNVTLSASYSGDASYGSASGTANITVTAPLTVSVPTQPPAVSKGGSSDVSVSFKTDGAYAGTVAVTCSLTQQPSAAQNVPQCSISAGSSLTFSATTTTGTATVHITTTAATTANLERHGLPPWAGAAGGSALALLVFFGIPARRRSWRNLLGLIVVLAALGSFSGCGGGSSSNNNNNNNNGGGGSPGTTSGNYVFTVTGTGNPAITPAPSTTITLTVN